MNRPDFKQIKSGAEFNQWYWLKTEMVGFCKQMNLPYHGRKFEIRDRIMYALDNNGSLQKEVKRKSTSSTFNWSKAVLTPDTKITDNITFGPNLRGFLKSQIGAKFSCHSDFMDWVKTNSGKTLADAVDIWWALEKRKDDPNFKRIIADNNMYAQYTRDFLAANRGMTIADAKKFWLMKKQKPTNDGFVRYETTDLNLNA